EGIFVAEGEKVVRRLLESQMEVISLLLPPKWLEFYAGLLAKRPEPHIRAYTSEKAALEELTGFTMYQAVLAIGRVPHRPNHDESTRFPCDRCASSHQPATAFAGRFLARFGDRAGERRKRTYTGRPRRLRRHCRHPDAERSRFAERRYGRRDLPLRSRAAARN